MALSVDHLKIYICIMAVTPFSITRLYNVRCLSFEEVCVFPLIYVSRRIGFNLRSTHLLSNYLYCITYSESSLFSCLYQSTSSDDSRSKISLCGCPAYNFHQNCMQKPEEKKYLANVSTKFSSLNILFSSQILPL